MAGIFGGTANRNRLARWGGLVGLLIALFNIFFVPGAYLPWDGTKAFVLNLIQALSSIFFLGLIGWFAGWLGDIQRPKR